MGGVYEKLVLRPGVKSTPAGHGRQAGCTDVLPLAADREISIGRDQHRQIAADIEFARAIALCRVQCDRWQRHFAGDKRVVGQDRCRKKRSPAKPCAVVSAPGSAATTATARPRQQQRYMIVLRNQIHAVPGWSGSGGVRLCRRCGVERGSLRPIDERGLKGPDLGRCQR